MSTLLTTLCFLVAVVLLCWRFPILRVWRRIPFEPTLRWLPKLLVVCSAILVVWIGLLILQSHGRVGQRSLGNSWIGLDLAELAGMLLTARLLHLRHASVSPVAAATATLLALDAWFDCQSAGAQLEYVMSLALAICAELPLALLLAWVSSRTLGWTSRSVPSQPLR